MKNQKNWDIQLLLIRTCKKSGKKVLINHNCERLDDLENLIDQKSKKNKNYYYQIKLK